MQPTGLKRRYVSPSAVAAIPELDGLDEVPTRAKAAPRAVAELAGEYAEAAVTTLHELLYGESDAIKLQAARELLDRAYGKPVQAVATAFDGKLTISWLRQGDTARVIEGETT